MDMRNPSLQALNMLVGEWTTEATHQMYSSTVVCRRSTFEWIEEEQAL